MSHSLAYRLGFGAAVGAALLLLSMIATVGVLAERGAVVDRIYYCVLRFGVIAALVVQLEARGMAYAMLATAAAQVLVIPSALASGLHRGAGNSLAEIVGVNVLFAAAFVGAAALFFYAAGAQRSATGASAKSS
jgi:hypothetical protein